MTLSWKSGFEETLSLLRKWRGSATGTPDCCFDVSGPRSSQSVCERPWLWSPGAGFHLAAAHSDGALSPRLGRMLYISFIPAEEGASAPFGAGVCHQVLPTIRSTGGSKGAAPYNVGPASGGLPSACGCRDLDLRERPLPTPLAMRRGVQEGTVCHVAAPG